MKQMKLAAAAGAAVMAVFFTDAADAAQTGKASYYKHGHRTASGERYDPHGFTAAHRTLPFGTKVLVTNLQNGKSVVVRINDRGPHTRGRLIDLSFGAAKAVGLVAMGVAKVKIATLDKVASEDVAAAVVEPGEGMVLVPPASAPAPAAAAAPAKKPAAVASSVPKPTPRPRQVSTASMSAGLVLVPPSPEVLSLR